MNTINSVFYERVNVKARINYQNKYELLLIYIMVQWNEQIITALYMYVFVNLLTAIITMLQQRLSLRLH